VCIDLREVAFVGVWDHVKTFLAEPWFGAAVGIASLAVGVLLTIFIYRAQNRDGEEMRQLSLDVRALSETTSRMVVREQREQALRDLARAVDSKWAAHLLAEAVTDPAFSAKDKVEFRRAYFCNVVVALPGEESWPEDSVVRSIIEGLPKRYAERSDTFDIAQELNPFSMMCKRSSPNPTWLEILDVFEDREVRSEDIVMLLRSNAGMAPAVAVFAADRLDKDGPERATSVITGLCDAYTDSLRSDRVDPDLQRDTANWYVEAMADLFGSAMTIWRDAIPDWSDAARPIHFAARMLRVSALSLGYPGCRDHSAMRVVQYSHDIAVAASTRRPEPATGFDGPPLDVLLDEAYTNFEAKAKPTTRAFTGKPAKPALLAAIAKMRASVAENPSPQ
jgi:hypothetical protein